jgi:ribosomal protein S18 acetylase RimI-like enzyme
LSRTSYRTRVEPADQRHVREILRSTGLFGEAEIAVAVELVHERLERGEASGYRFLFAERSGATVGFACWGLIAGTVESADLYWIAVRQDQHRQGIGKVLLRRAEAAISCAGGRRIHIETSSRESYEPTRAFYRSRGYRECATLEDFYGPGDAKVIFLKVV